MIATLLSVEQTRLQYTGRALRLLDQIREVIRLKHYSIRTETAYVDWVRRFVRFCDCATRVNAVRLRSRLF